MDGFWIAFEAALRAPLLLSLAGFVGIWRAMMWSHRQSQEMRSAFLVLGKDAGQRHGFDERLLAPHIAAVMFLSVMIFNAVVAALALALLRAATAVFAGV
jgi:hypothetical protein